jgi:WD40 repeat protein/serine/threonine protein kinase
VTRSPLRRVEEVFDAAADLPASQRGRFLDRACAGDEALRAEVESLLRHEGHADSDLLGGAPRRPSGGRPPEGEEPLHVRTRLGAYTLGRIVGEGGCGVVYAADQEQPVRRKVALKIIKLGMDTREVVGRFEAERQALAMMDHTGIARVFDAGTTERGRPFFVMEFVEGRALTDYCDDQRLAIPERLELFGRVCYAIGHAHQKGVIHRDIKPGNVLVAVEDGRPVPKVIDFGIARAIDQPLDGRTAVTLEGRPIGTPEYMSPEQAGINIRGVDTRTDVYSLGVLLYELLVGALPLDPATLRSASPAEVQRIIRDIEPGAPSVRLGGLPPRVAQEAAARRRTSPELLRCVLRHDLDWIVMKAIRKDREQRYQTARELAADVERFLLHLPVLARPASPWYTLRKLAGRHRALVGGAAAVLLTLMAGVVGTTWGLFEASAARVGAEKQRDAAVIASRNADRERETARRQGYAADIAAAAAALADGDAESARKFLDRAPPELRNWEWQYLDCSADQSLAVLRGHTSYVMDVAYTRDGSRLVSGSMDGTVRVWDARTGDLVRLIRSGAAVFTLALSADDRRVVVADKTESLSIWDLSTGLRLGEHRIPGAAFVAVCFSPDGATLASGECDGHVALWGAADTQPRWRAQPRFNIVRKVAFNATGTVFCSCDDDGFTTRWDPATGQPGWSVQLAPSHLASVAFSPDDSLLAAAGVMIPPLSVIDAATGQRKHDLEGHTQEGIAVAFARDGTLVSGSADGMIRLWDAAAGTPRGTLRGHTGWVRAVAVRADGLRLASCSDDLTVRIWSLPPRAQPLAMDAAGGWVFGVAFDSLENRLATAHLDGAVRIWDAATGAALQTLLGHSGHVSSVAFSPNGARLASAGGDGSVRLWDPLTGAAISEAAVHSEIARTVVFSADGRNLASAGDDGVLRVADADGHEQFVRRGSHPWGCLAASADGRWAWGAAPDQIIVLGQDGAEDFSSPQSGDLGCLAFSHDGSLLACGYQSGVLRILNGRTGAELRAMKAHTSNSQVRALAFTPDGQRLLSAGGWDHTLKVWDTATGQELFTLRGPQHWGLTLSFDRAGERLATGTWGSEAHIFDSVNTYTRAARAAAPAVAQLLRECQYRPRDAAAQLSNIAGVDVPTRELALLRATADLQSELSSLYPVLFAPDADASRVAARLRQEPGLSDAARAYAAHLLEAAPPGSGG